MDITLSSLANRSHFSHNFGKWIRENKGSKGSEQLLSFIRVYLERFPLEEWVGRNIGDLYGLCFGLFHQFKNPPADAANVQVFNPSLEEHGWQCGRSVIIIHQKDMPFLVDSVRIALSRCEVPIYTIKSTVLRVSRSADTLACSLSAGNDNIEGEKEALMYLEVSLQPSDEELKHIRSQLVSGLNDVAVVVNDHQPVLEKLDVAKANLAKHFPNNSEVQEFVGWLRHRHFAFLGYRDYQLVTNGKKKELREIVDQRLGVFRNASTETAVVPQTEFSLGIKDFYEGDSLICFSKASTHSSVHRAVYPDYVVLKKYDDKGELCGEVRFLGLFTYEVFMLSPFDIPILRKKVNDIVARSDMDLSSHDGKNLRRTIESYPRAELLLTDTDSLFTNIMSIVETNERHMVRLIVRPDPFGNFVTCNVFVPREVYSTSVRQKIQDILSETFSSKDFDFNTYFSESSMVRAQFIFRISKPYPQELSLRELEDQVVEVTRNWDDNLRASLVEEMGESRGISSYNLYKNGFASGYQENFDARYAVQDIKLIEGLQSDDNIAMNFYQPIGFDENRMRFRVLHRNEALVLSDIIPILEHLGLRVIGEHPYKIYKKDGTRFWLHDFELDLGIGADLDVHAVKSLFEQAFAAVWRNQAESDAFNKLVLGARLNWREVCLLRAYAGYMKQIGFNADQNFIAETLANHTEITRNLVAVFKTAFDPRLNKESKTEERVQRLTSKIKTALDDVANLNEDRVLRRYLELIDGTLRTNFFQTEKGTAKDYIAFKFSPRSIPDIPEPRPLFEIYVYSPRVEGAHLRGGKVARGGLRWSDRLQDYRTEVLGLVKAQQVKNAVIVPNGAKGGFVCKKPPLQGGRDAILAEGIACYKTFICGLLDLTDNLVNGSVVTPDAVVCRDEQDPYLVVAADKGTATFSDIANEISLKYNHWLGDAFASGGSQGYDHKGMGITAKGAWVSVQRHFREMGVDIQKEDFSVVGIGDMGGDVFGNGMLLSEHICLKAAFNHLHIFIDPTPHSATSYKERKRLFETPRTSWADYEKTLISAGGGVFLRAAKSIAITTEMKAAFGIGADALTSTELICALLKSPVDLIWNGGIGTYVKSHSESHADVGDKANDSLRVNGGELRCKVFGEGGNLGVTQRGRIEYALAGGACNTDFIDNAAGVDCSDHEVNIKILLDEQVVSGDLTTKQRNKLLSDMTQEVSDLVLQNNYRQAQAISIAQFQASVRSTEYRRFVSFLENTGRLDRGLEFLPSDEEISERGGQGKHLTRPELSVLISYAKVMMKDELINSDIAEDAYIAQAIETAFPKTIMKKLKKPLYKHRLKKEIVGTQIANDFINNLGITAGHRLIETTGASVAEIARAYVVSRDVFEFEAFQQYIKSLDHKVASSLQAELSANMIRRVRRGTRWFLRNRRLNLNPEADVEFFKSGLKTVHRTTGNVMEGAAREEWLARSRLFEELKVPEDWALRLAMPDNLFSGLGVIESSLSAKVDVELATEVFFDLLDRLDLNWFASQLSNVKVENYWQALARESYLDELDSHLRRLTIALVSSMESTQQGDIAAVLDACFGENESLVVRWRRMITEVQSSSATDYAMFSVALRELLDLVVATDHYAQKTKG